MKLIITGGAGFIGSNLIRYWLRTHPNDSILNLDKLTYAANPKNLESISTHQYSFAKVDIADRKAVRDAIYGFGPDGVIHLAAESHVDNSISGPEAFVMTNIVGTFNLLEETRQYWNENSGSKPKRFLHISTDEVFGSLGPTGAFSESSPYAPNSPYSATKAGSDHLVRAYYQTYGTNVVTTNCSNNFGPHQHSEKLIPTVIRKAIDGESIPIYGKGTNIRDWLYVEDHCRGIELVFNHGRTGETYVIGGSNEWNNLELAKIICDLLNKIVGKAKSGDYKSQITFVTDRLGHDHRYAIDASKIKNELGWKLNSGFHAQMEATIRWYLEELK